MVETILLRINLPIGADLFIDRNERLGGNPSLCV